MAEPTLERTGPRTLEDAKRWMHDKLAKRVHLSPSPCLARVRALEQARLSAGNRLDASRTGFEVGDRTVLDLLDAERELQTADVSLQQARHAVLLGRLNLAAACGALDEAALSAVNQFFADQRLP